MLRGIGVLAAGLILAAGAAVAWVWFNPPPEPEPIEWRQMAGSALEERDCRGFWVIIETAAHLNRDKSIVDQGVVMAEQTKCENPDEVTRIKNLLRKGYF